MPIRVEAIQIIQKKEIFGQVQLPRVEAGDIFSRVIQEAQEQDKIMGGDGGNVPIPIDTPKLGGAGETPVWIKPLKTATASGSGNCVEVGQFANGMIGIGDTKQQESEKVFLSVSPDALERLFASIRHGKLK